MMTELATRRVSMADSVTLDDFRAVMGSFASSVTVVTTIDEAGIPRALTATAFSSVSADPPLCLVCVDKGAGANPAIAGSGRFAVNILGEAQAELSNHFASRIEDKFEGIDWRAGTATGCPLLAGVLASAECEVTSVLPGGDHDIFVGRVIAASARDGAPLLYWRGNYEKLDRDT